MTDEDRAILAAIAVLRPGAAFNYDYGKGLVGLTWLDQQKPRPTDDEIRAEMANPSPSPSITEAIEGLTDRVVAVRVLKERAMSDSESQQPAPEAVTQTTPLPPAPTIAPPPVVAAPPAAKRSPDGGFAASLRAIVEEARDGVKRARADATAEVRSAVDELGRARDATVKVGSQMAQRIRAETSDVMAELGQISNDL